MDFPTASKLHAGFILPDGGGGRGWTDIFARLRCYIYIVLGTTSLSQLSLLIRVVYDIPRLLFKVYGTTDKARKETHNMQD